jgi:hypothetical protein
LFLDLIFVLIPKNKNEKSFGKSEDKDSENKDKKNLAYTKFLIA